MGRGAASEKSKAKADARGMVAGVATPSRRREGAAGAAAGGDRARGPPNSLEELMRRKGVDEAWNALEEMQSQGAVTDKYTVSRMLMKTVGDGRGKINPTRVYRGISLVEKFIDMQPKDVDEVLFNALLDTCCRLKDLSRLESTLSRMRELNVSPSPVTLGILVKTYGQAGDLQKVLQVWTEMDKQRGQANAVTYGCMIDACVKCGHLEKAVEIFKGMRESGKHRNTILYTTLIKGYGLEKDLTNALELFREMPQEGVAYNTITYNSILDACVKCGDLSTAESLLREMTQNDSNVEPDLITFSTLLKGYCHVGDLDKALQVAESIKARGLHCDELVYNTLMDGCVKANDLAAGVGLFEEMMQSGLRPSAITHSILARLYQRAGYDDSSAAIAQLYQQHGIERPSGGDRGRGGSGQRGGRRMRSPSGGSRAGGERSGSETPLGSLLGSPSGASARSEGWNPFGFEGFECPSAGHSAPATPLGSPTASPASSRGGPAGGLCLPAEALRCSSRVPPLPGAETPGSQAAVAGSPTASPYNVDQSPTSAIAMPSFGALGGCAAFAQAPQPLPPFPFPQCPSAPPGADAGAAGAQQLQQVIAMPMGSPVAAATGAAPAGFGALSEPPHSALSPTSAQPMGSPTGMMQTQQPSFMLPMPGHEGAFAVAGGPQQAYFESWGHQLPQQLHQQLPQPSTPVQPQDQPMQLSPEQLQQQIQQLQQQMAQQMAQQMQHQLQHMQQQIQQQQQQQQLQHMQHLMNPTQMGGCVGPVAPGGATFEPSNFPC